MSDKTEIGNDWSQFTNWHDIHPKEDSSRRESVPKRKHTDKIQMPIVIIFLKEDSKKVKGTVSQSWLPVSSIYLSN